MLRPAAQLSFLALIALCGSAWTAVAHAQEEGSGAVPRGGSGAVVKPPAEEEQPKKPVVVPPKLVHFESAPYPPEAQKAGLQGDVVLKLTIDATGAVTHAEVAEPGGHGFDEAAQTAALKFKFEPATRDGKPIPAKIRFRSSAEP